MTDRQSPPATGAGRPLSTDGETAARIALVRGTAYVSFLFDATGTVLWASPSVEQVLERPPEDFVGRSVADELHRDDLGIYEQFMRLISTTPLDGSLDREDSQVVIDVRVRHRDGHWVNLDVLVNNLLATEGVHAILAVGRDVTARRTLDAALAALGNAPTGDQVLELLVEYLERRFPSLSVALYAPTEVRRWVGQSLPASVLVDQGPWRHAFRQGRNLLVDNVATASAEIVPAALATAASRAGLVSCWCLVVPVVPEVAVGTVRLPEPGPHPLGVVVVWRKQPGPPMFGVQGTAEWVGGLIHRALARRQDVREQRDRLEAEQAQNRRLTELDAVRTELFRTVSHELRTPLTSIVSFTDLLRDGLGRDDQADQETFLEIIGRNADRMLRLVGDLSLLGNLESQSLAVSVGPVNVTELVERTVMALRPEAEAKDLRLDCQAETGPPISGDEVRLAQVVDNLVANAVKYTLPGGRISVRAGPRSDGWRIAVADTGIGIPPAELDRLFEQFYRASNARVQDANGSGLGLSIALGIARLHGGTIRVASEEGRGSIFTLVLRGMDADPPQRTAVQPPPAAGSAATASV